MRTNSVSYSYQAEQTLDEYRDRLVEWLHKPSRAKKLFAADLDRWDYSDSAADPVVLEQQRWAEEQYAARGPRAGHPGPRHAADRADPAWCRARRAVGQGVELVPSSPLDYLSILITFADHGQKSLLVTVRSSTYDGQAVADLDGDLGELQRLRVDVPRPRLVDAGRVAHDPAERDRRDILALQQLLGVLDERRACPARSCRSRRRRPRRSRPDSCAPGCIPPAAARSLRDRHREHGDSGPDDRRV